MPGLYDLIPESRPIDYDKMKREYPKLKAALTRATNSHDWVKQLEAVERFISVSDEVGCMPDDWPRWRNALEDAWDVFHREAYDGFPADLYDASGDASPVVRFQKAAARF